MGFSLKDSLQSLVLDASCIRFKRYTSLEESEKLANVDGPVCQQRCISWRALRMRCFFTMPACSLNNGNRTESTAMGWVPFSTVQSYPGSLFDGLSTHVIYNVLDSQYLFHTK